MKRNRTIAPQRVTVRFASPLAEKKHEPNSLSSQRGSYRDESVLNPSIIEG